MKIGDCEVYNRSNSGSKLVSWTRPVPAAGTFPLSALSRTV